MIKPTFNYLTSLVFKKRMREIELFLKYPNETQTRVLLQLLKKAKNTEIGKKYGFINIKKYEDFSNQVPLNSYEDYAIFIERSRKGEENVFWHTPIKWFAKSSGTTNAKSKFIPISKDSLNECHYKAGKDSLCLYVYNNSNTSLFKGKFFRIGGSVKIYNEGNNYFGDLSAILFKNSSFWSEIFSVPKLKTSLLSEWENKIQRIIRETHDVDVRGLLGVPSWMLVTLNKLLEYTQKKHILEVWPNLEVYFHGGINFNPYKNQYKRLLPNNDLKYYEIYNASEGFFAAQDTNNLDEMLLLLDHGIFYEFIPFPYKDKNKAVSLANVELNKNYEIVITTNSGLWRYRIGDTIQFTSLNPYRIKVTGRTKYYINAFGEELILDNVEKALKVASKKCNLEVLEYTLSPIFMDKNKIGRHEWIIEFKKRPQNLKLFSKLLDDNLKQLNSDYEAKRYKNMTIGFPKIHAVSEGLFYKWFGTKNRLGGQNKVPRMLEDRKIMEELLKEIKK